MREAQFIDYPPTASAVPPIPKHGRCASLHSFNSLFRSQLTSLLPALRALGSLPRHKGGYNMTSIRAPLARGAGGEAD